MIEKPILVRKPSELRYTKNGAFDIPTYITSVAMSYFSGSISLKGAALKLLQGGHDYLAHSKDEVLVAKLRKSLEGNERFFDYLEEGEPVSRKAFYSFKEYASIAEKMKNSYDFHIDISQFDMDEIAIIKTLMEDDYLRTFFGKCDDVEAEKLRQIADYQLMVGRAISELSKSLSSEVS